MNCARVSHEFWAQVPIQLYKQLLYYAPDRMTRHIPPPCSCHSDRGYDDIVDDNDWRTLLQLLGLRQLGTYNCRIRYFIPRRAMRCRNLRKSSHHFSRLYFVNIQCVCVFHLKCIIQRAIGNVFIVYYGWNYDLSHFILL